MAPKYYIYWNLHKKKFSVKYKGKVIFHCDSIVAINVQFNVSALGRERVLREQRKNVHAFVVANSIFPHDEPWGIMDDDIYFEPVKYNPYKYATFVDICDQPVYNAGVVWLSQEDNKGILRIVKNARSN